MSNQITLHVTISHVPDDFFSDEQYQETEDYIIMKLREIADGVDGSLYDFEIK